MSTEYADIIEELGIKDSDYCIVDPEESVPTDLDSPIHEIEITADNPWKGLRVRYGRVTLTPSDEANQTGEATLSFDCEVTNVEEEIASEIDKDEDLGEFLGRMLHHIIIKSFETGDYRIGGQDSDDSNDDSA